MDNREHYRKTFRSEKKTMTLLENNLILIIEISKPWLELMLPIAIIFIGLLIYFETRKKQ